MPEPLMTLGSYVFGVDRAAYDTLKRTVEYRWPSQDRIGRRPSRQWVGPGEDIIELSGTIYAVRRPPDAELEALRAEASGGEPLRLMMGSGEILGLWVVERISGTGTMHFAGGSPRKLEFRVRLAFYGEDGGVELLAGDTAVGQAAAVATLPQPLPSELPSDLPATLAGSLPVALPADQAGALPPALPEGLATGRDGPFAAVLSALADSRVPAPSAVGRLRSQVRQVTGHLNIERQARTWLQGLPGNSQAEDIARAGLRIDALEAVLKPPEAVLSYVDSL